MQRSGRQRNVLFQQKKKLKLTMFIIHTQLGKLIVTLYMYKHHIVRIQLYFEDNL